MARGARMLGGGPRRRRLVREGAILAGVASASRAAPAPAGLESRGRLAHGALLRRGPPLERIGTNVGKAGGPASFRHAEGRFPARWPVAHPGRGRRKSVPVTGPAAGRRHDADALSRRLAGAGRRAAWPSSLAMLRARGPSGSPRGCAGLGLVRRSGDVGLDASKGPGRPPRGLHLQTPLSPIWGLDTPGGRRGLLRRGGGARGRRPTSPWGDRCTRAWYRSPRRACRPPFGRTRCRARGPG